MVMKNMSKEFEKKHIESFFELLKNGNTDDDLDFDMYARDIADFAWLKEFIPEIIIYSAGGLCPFQAEGYLGEYTFYYRERGGFASLSLAMSKEDCYGASDNLYRSSIEVEEFREGPGWFSTLMNLIEKLERNSYLYQFQRDEVDYGTNNNPDDIKKKLDEEGEVVHGSTPAWGFTAEEAFEKAARLEYLSNFFTNRTKYDEELKKYVPAPELNWTEEQIAKYVELANVQFIVREERSSKERVYPEIDPVFEVKVPEMWRNENGLIEIPQEFWKQ